MPTSDEPRAAPSPGAYAGHQMIELERLGACPAECRGRIVRLQATWRPSFAFGGRPFLRPSLRPQVVLAPSSPRRTMAAMVDLLLRRAPAASAEVYDVPRGKEDRRADYALQWLRGIAVGLDHILPLPRGPHADTWLRAYPGRCHEGVLPQLASGMKRTRHKRVPSPRRRTLEFIAAHLDGCTEALLAAETSPPTS